MSSIFHIHSVSVEKYQYFLCTDDKMRLWGGGRGNKLAHFQHIDFHVLKNVCRLESGWNNYTPAISTVFLVNRPLFLERKIL